MPGPIDSSGDIEIYAHAEAGAASRGSAFFGAINPGDTVYLVFNPDTGASPPYKLKVTSPSDKTILETMVRDLPTGGPQSPPPISFVVSARGVYRIDISEARGRQKGLATLRVD